MKGWRALMERVPVEHGRTAYWLDFAAYGGAALVLAIRVLRGAVLGAWPNIAVLVTSGAACWTLVEYVLHRWVLHRIEPFRTWHDQHHRRPMALISTPTWITGGLIAGLVYAPARWLGGPEQARALTLGFVTAYLAYAITHHAVHHWRLNGAWLKRLKQWHAMHHHRGNAACYGVSCTLWDRVFRSAARRDRR